MQDPTIPAYIAVAIMLAIGIGFGVTLGHVLSMWYKYFLNKNEE